MKRIFLPFYLLFTFSIALSAQNPVKTSIKGIVQDTSGEVIPFATVMLLNSRDSALINFTRGDEQGTFSFNNVRNNPYLLKISYIGMVPFQQYIEPSKSEIHDMGKLTMKPINTQLMEVVIKSAKAPLRIHGDTIEYDATTFKVPPGSTVEDLLRRLPGIDVDADGNLKAQGKDVKRLYVDGKTFFGDDPKSATKNLGAETISKVQVFDDKTEQSRLTGIDDGVKDKAMNLQLKDEYKKGSFGKVSAGVGTEERWVARGNYNRFDTKNQLSFIGFANNINQTGVNWEDYSEFKGQNAYSDFDDGDFGFSSGGNFHYLSFDGPVNNFDGRGFTKNLGGGTNYNYDNTRSKLNASYFYNQTALNFDQNGERQSFLKQNSFFNTDTLNKTDFRSNHTFNARLEQNIDSNNVFIIKLNGRIGLGNSSSHQYQLFNTNNEPPSNYLSLNNDSDQSSYNINSIGLYRHFYKKKGRVTAFSIAYGNNKSSGIDNLLNINQFFDATSFSDQVKQLNKTNNHTQQIKSSILHTEPFSKKLFLETFYNFNSYNTNSNRQVMDAANNDIRLDSLSVYNDYSVLYNRIGTSLHYSYEGINVAGGLAAQQFQLDGKYSRDMGLPLLLDPIKRTYFNWIPNISANLEIQKRAYYNASYSYIVNEPRFNDLQPVPNVSNPAFRTLGNPNLQPERSHHFNMGYHFWNPSSFGSLGISGDMDLYDSQVVYNQIVEVLDSGGIRTTTIPDNASGGRRYSAYLWSNFPIIKTKLTLSVGGSASQNISQSKVNDDFNKTNSTSYGARIGLNLTPNPKITLGLNGNMNFSFISYSIQKDQNQQILNHNLDASVKWQFLNKTFFESNFNYALYRNLHFNFNSEIPIWNASIRQLLGKENKWEIRLAGFDLLNQRIYINQRGTQNYITKTIAPTLARYVMLSLSYNIKGFENKLKKEGGMWF